jgi:hypothetical protein
MNWWPTPRFRVQHTHQCGACGGVWAHDDSKFDDRAAHTCPRCNSGPWWEVSGYVARISLYRQGASL